MVSTTAVADLTQNDRSAAPFQTEEFRRSRPSIVGPEKPEAPFPIKFSGPVQRGFGRGGKDLGCPTANLPDDSTGDMAGAEKMGVYYGYAQVIPPQDKVGEFEQEELGVLPMVMSMGSNPFYNNQKLSVEIHVMYPFKRDFYDYEMRAVVLGYIRPELNYVSKEALIDDIETDKCVAMRCLERPGYQKYAKDDYFKLE